MKDRVITCLNVCVYSVHLLKKFYFKDLTLSRINTEYSARGIWMGVGAGKGVGGREGRGK